MDQSSVASSFYEPKEVYDEGKTRGLYENLIKNFEEVNGTLVSIDKDMKHFQRQSMLTVKLIEKIKATEAESNQDSPQK